MACLREEIAPPADWSSTCYARSSPDATVALGHASARVGRVREAGEGRGPAGCDRRAVVAPHHKCSAQVRTPRSCTSCLSTPSRRCPLPEQGSTKTGNGPRPLPSGHEKDACQGEAADGYHLGGAHRSILPRPITTHGVGGRGRRPCPLCEVARPDAATTRHTSGSISFSDTMTVLPVCQSLSITTRK